MMRWIAIFTDTPQMLVARKARELLHRDYLLKHNYEILIAGGCRELPDGQLVGGLWVMKVGSREPALELIENDPLYEPKFRKFQLFVWSKAFPDKEVCL